VVRKCLASRGLKVPEGGKDQHDIGKLFEWCRKKKLLGLDDKHFNMNNLIALLGQGNRWQRYRYPGPNPNNEHDHFIPDLGWLHETVGQLFEAVEPHVAEWVAKNPLSPPPPTIRGALKLLGPPEPIPISLPAGDAIIAPAVGEPAIDPTGGANHDPTGPPAKAGVCNP